MRMIRGGGTSRSASTLQTTRRSVEAQLSAVHDQRARHSPGRDIGLAC
jgi:hypothetical protein